MFIKPYVLLLILSLGSTFCSADTFTVTSNGDNGVGTLRDALEKAAANGTVTTDYIHFNIPQLNYNLRIIDLLTELPPISSNVILDGTTQAGAAYGTTDAKVCLRKLTYSSFFSMLKIENAQHVKIYGIHLYYGYWQGFFSTPRRSEDLYGVNITRSSNINIGEPGKGNVITGVVHAIYSGSEGCSDITIQSNFLGHSQFYPNISDDVDNVITSSSSCITLANVKNIFIGGESPAEGNTFGSRSRGINIDSRHPTGNGVIRIRHNVFGRGYDKVTIIYTYDFWDKYIHIGRSRNNPINYSMDGVTDYRVELLDNNIQNDAEILRTTDSVIVLRNRFDYDGRTHGAKLQLSIPGSGVIGTDDPKDANYFLNKKPGYAGPSIFNSSTGPVGIFKNIFTCNSTYGSTVSVINNSNKNPFAQIDITTNAVVTGRATPNARIDLYYDDECSACEGKAYLATVQSDPAGAWTYSGVITGTVIATATKDGYTSEFSFPTFNLSRQKVTQPVCGLSNGSIRGITTEGAESYFWLNSKTNDTVSKTRDLVNVGPGDYQLFAVHGGTCIMPMNNIIRLEDVSPAIVQAPSTADPSCGLSNGYIRDLRVSGTLNSRLEWKNELGDVISDQLSINQLAAGKYTFYATDLTAGCAAVSATYELVNQSGPSLNAAAIQVTSTTCDKANGAITGISAVNVSGTPFIQWVDASDIVVSSGFSLINAHAGTYRLKFKDASTCDTIIRPYTVPALTSFNPINVTAYTVEDGICDEPNGTIEIHSFSKAPDDYTFKWKEARSGSDFGNSTTLSNLNSGSYQLFATDINGCESNIFSASVKRLPKPSFDYSSVVIKNEQCSLQDGGVASLRVTGLISPTLYEWFDANNRSVGNHVIALQQVPAGVYRLKVTDARTCNIESSPFTIENASTQMAAPVYQELTISRYTSAKLVVKNYSRGNYTLFSDASGLLAIDQNNTGTFTIINVEKEKTVYVQQSNGSCVSPLVPVVIKVVDKSYFTIPNAFTPNHDQVNDRLPVRVHGVIALTYFRIYNRWGNVVFETTRLNDSWDGTSNGLQQLKGTYVWVAEGKDINGVTIRDKGNVVLIR